MNNPNAVDNLIPAVKGEIRNPKGRGKGSVSFTTLLKRLLKQKVDIKDQNGNVILKATKKRVILLKWMEKAMQGDVRAIEGVVDRIEGKPKTSGEITVKNPISSMKDEEIKSILDKYGIDVGIRGTGSSSDKGTAQD